MAAARQLTGWTWLIAPLGLLAFDVWSETTRDFIRWSYYFVLWGSLLALSACGAWFLIDMPGAKWLLRLVAVLVSLFVVLNFLIVWSNAPFYSGHDPITYAIMAGALSFCVFTYYIAGRSAA